MDEVGHNHGIISLSGRLLDYANTFIHEELVREGINDILPCHGDILYAVFRKRGQKVTEIAAMTHRSKSTVSAMVEKLRDLGYLKKERDKDDPRAQVISPTPKGEAIMPVFFKISERLMHKLSSNLSEDEKITLESLLSRALQSFEHKDEAAKGL